MIIGFTGEEVLACFGDVEVRWSCDARFGEVVGSYGAVEDDDEVLARSGVSLSTSSTTLLSAPWSTSLLTVV